MISEITEIFDLDTPTADRKREEFRKYLIDSIEEVLSFSMVVLNFLEMNTAFKRSSILEHPGIFSSELEDLFGHSARGIEDLILERLYKKINRKYVKDKNKNFEEYIDDALKGYIKYY